MFKINKSVYIFALIAVLTASFINFIVISTLIIIHELGHFLVAKLLKVEVNKIYLYPLGGISKFNLDLNSSPIIELLILISGPIFQVIAAQTLITILPSYTDLVKIYHYQILFFNLLPIYPLDGGKLLNVILSLKIPYKASLNYTIIVSYTVLLIIILINTNNIKLNILFMSIFLFYKITKEKKKISTIYEKFLLERYLKKYKFKDTKIINNSNNFYRNKKHLIKKDQKYYYETEFLEKKYNFFNKSVDF